MIFFYCFIIAFFLIRLGVLLFTRHKQKSCQQEFLEPANTLSPRIWFILPALNESKIAAETIAHFSSLLNSRRKQCKLLVITSQESREDDTYSVLRELQQQFDFSLEHDALSQSKQEKLNRIYLQLKSSSSEPFWLFVFDFDARPSLSLIEKAIAGVNDHDETEMFQAIPVTTPKKGFGLFSHLTALDHLYRVMYVESFLNHFKWRYYLRLGMGACLLIKNSALDKIGGFPENSDDIELGYRLDLCSVNRKTIMEYPTVTPVATIGSYFRQYSRIMLGVLSLHRVFLDIPIKNSRAIKTKIITYSTNFFSLLILLLTLLFSFLYPEQYYFLFYWLSEIIIQIALLAYFRKIIDMPTLNTCIFHLLVSPISRPALQLLTVSYYYFVKGKYIKNYSTER